MRGLNEKGKQISSRFMAHKMHHRCRHLALLERGADGCMNLGQRDGRKTLERSNGFANLQLTVQYISDISHGQTNIFTLGYMV